MAIKDIMKTSMQNFANEAYKRFAEVDDFNTLDGKVETLIGSDANKSARTIANEELAAQLIPSNAKEALDTLQEIASWIQSHPDEAAAINAKLTLGTYDDEGTQKQYATVKAYVEAYVASQLTASSLSGSASIDITDQAISLIIDTANANGLTIGDDGLKLAVATDSVTGALSAADHATFAAKQEQIIVPAATGDGNAITEISLNTDNKTIGLVKGETFVKVSDIEELTAAECVAIFNTAKENAESAGD